MLTIPRVGGTKYSEEKVKEMNEKAYLKKEVCNSLLSYPFTLKLIHDSFSVQTDLGDCAQAYLDIARNTSMTGQRIQVGMYNLLNSLCTSYQGIEHLD